MPSQNASSSMSGAPAAPSGSSSGNGTDGAGDAGMVNAATDNESFLRGIWRTDEEGQLNMTSIIPGVSTSAHLSNRQRTNCQSLIPVVHRSSCSRAPQGLQLRRRLYRHERHIRSQQFPRCSAHWSILLPPRVPRPRRHVLSLLD
jgi:hypothetical protein